MVASQVRCPRCGGTEFQEEDRGRDLLRHLQRQHISYSSDVCQNCRLTLSGWTDKWHEEDDEAAVYVDFHTREEGAGVTNAPHVIISPWQWLQMVYDKQLDEDYFCDCQDCSWKMQITRAITLNA